MTYDRDEVFGTGDGLCASCGKQLSRGNSQRSGRGGWEVDHSHPRSQGGTDNMSNLNALCWKCNSDKGDDYSSLNEYQNEFEPATTGGKIREGINDVSDLIGYGHLPNGFMGSSKLRTKK